MIVEKNYSKPVRKYMLLEGYCKNKQKYILLISIGD